MIICNLKSMGTNSYYLLLSSCIMWSRNGIVMALLKYSLGFKAGTLFLCVCLPVNLVTWRVTSILVANCSAASYHILL